jgi:hypothetical protein
MEADLACGVMGQRMLFAEMRDDGTTRKRREKKRKKP